MCTCYFKLIPFFFSVYHTVIYMLLIEQNTVVSVRYVLLSRQNHDVDVY